MGTVPVAEAVRAVEVMVAAAAVKTVGAVGAEAAVAVVEAVKATEVIGVANTVGVVAWFASATSLASDALMMLGTSWVLTGSPRCPPVPRV
jgi:hypothetical protein